MDGGDVGGSRSWKSRVEIDTSAPFRSVKEAVSLFGEKALAERISSSSSSCGGNRDVVIDEVHHHGGHIRQSRSSVAAELEEAKRHLEKAKEESTLTATRLSSLNLELEKTKKELEEVKGCQKRQIIKDLKLLEAADDDDDLKYVEVSVSDPLFVQHTGGCDRGGEKRVPDEFVWEKKQLSFTTTTRSPASLPKIKTRVGGGSSGRGGSSPAAVVLERHPSLKKKKKVPLLPLMIGSLFAKRKTNKYHHHHDI